MDILKLNKLFFAFLILLVATSCEDKVKKSQKICDCEKVIDFDTHIVLSSKEARNSLNSLKIEHIRNGKIIENIAYEYRYSIGAKKSIKISRTKDLYRTDTIKFTLKKGEIIFIHDFIVTPKFVGPNNKHFVACITEYCKKNDKDSVNIKDGIWL